MSRRLYWEPANGGHASGAGLFIDELEKIFGPNLTTLGEHQVRELTAALRLCPHHQTQYQELIDAIEKHGTIRLRVEY